MSLKVRPSKHLEYTQAELDAAYLRCAEEWGARENARRERAAARAKMTRAERLADFRKMIEETPLLPSFGREPERHEKIVHHARTGQLWVGGFGYMDEDMWEDILKWDAESAAS